MDQICVQPIHLHSLYRAHQLFIDVCNNQTIFTILYDYMGCTTFLTLTTTNSQVKAAIQKHQAIQVKILKLKINLLKQRQFKRKMSKYLWIDLELFNPFTLPPYEEPDEQLTIQDQEQLQKQRIRLQSIKLGDNESLIKGQWSKWRGTHKLSKLSLKQKLSLHRIKQKQKLKDRQAIQRQQIYKKAEMFHKNSQQLKRKIIQEYPITTNQLQGMRNKHFFQNFITKNDLKNYYQTHKNLQNNNTNSIDYQFYQASSDDMKKKIANKLWKAKIHHHKNQQFQLNPAYIVNKVTNTMEKVIKAYSSMGTIKSMVRAYRRPDDLSMI